MAPVANLVAGAVLTGDHSLLWTPESSATLGAPGTELRVKRTSGGRGSGWRSHGHKPVWSPAVAPPTLPLSARRTPED
jgi:hypothetical protein